MEKYLFTNESDKVSNAHVLFLIEFGIHGANGIEEEPITKKEMLRGSRQGMTVWTGWPDRLTKAGKRSTSKPTVFPYPE